MVKLCIFIGSGVLGSVGWWLGEQVSGQTAALVLSSIGSIAGAFLGWRLVRDYLE